MNKPKLINIFILISFTLGNNFILASYSFNPNIPKKVQKQQKQSRLFKSLLEEIQKLRHDNNIDPNDLLVKAQRLVDMAQTPSEKSSSSIILNKIHKRLREAEICSKKVRNPKQSQLKGKNVEKEELFLDTEPDFSQAKKGIEDLILEDNIDENDLSAGAQELVDMAPAKNEQLQSSIISDKVHKKLNMPEICSPKVTDSAQGQLIYTECKDLSIENCKKMIKKSSDKKYILIKYSELIKIYGKKKLYLEAEEAFAQAMRDFQDINGNEFLHMKVMLHFQMGKIYSGLRGQEDIAHKYFEGAYSLNNAGKLRYQDLDKGMNFNNNIKVDYHLAQSFGKRGDLGQAEQIFAEGLKYIQDNMIPNVSCHDIPLFYSAHIQLYLSCPNGKKCTTQQECNIHLEQAENLLKKYIEDSKKIYAYDTYALYWQYSELLKKQRRLSEALDYLNQGLKIANRFNKINSGMFENAILVITKKIRKNKLEPSLKNI